MSTTLIHIGGAHIARVEGRGGRILWQPLWPDERTGGWCSDASDAAGGGRITHHDPLVVAADDRAAAYSTRQRALAALAEHGVDIPMGAPRRDPTAARVVRAYRVHPDTAAKIAAASEASGESQGQIVDRLAHGLSS